MPKESAKALATDPGDVAVMLAFCSRAFKILTIISSYVFVFIVGIYAPRFCLILKVTGFEDPD